MHRPEIEPGFVAEVDRHAAHGLSVFDGDEVAVGAVLTRATEFNLRTNRIAQVPEVEGVVWESALAPTGHLLHEVLVPGAELETEPRDSLGVGRLSTRAARKRCHAVQCS